MAPNNLVLGLAGPYGAGCSSLAKDLEKIINDWPGCSARRIQVSSMIEKIASEVFPGEFTEIPEDEKAERRSALQEAGTKLRLIEKEFIGRAIIAEIYKEAQEVEKENPLDNIGTLVLIVDSLKNENDINPLRVVYGNEFYLTFVHANSDSRWQRMQKYKSWNQKSRQKFDQLDSIDSDEKSEKPEVKDAGQQVKKISSLADYFIVNHFNRDKLREDGERFLHLLFGFGINQPTDHERFMHLAYSAMNRSGCLSRQVGAAIFDPFGNVLGVGHNDVPKSKGGLYTSLDVTDRRCYKLGDRRCINDTNKLERFAELGKDLLENVKKYLLMTQNGDGNLLDMVDQPILEKIIEETVKKSPFKEATEYCRAVHAEMEAILSTARTGRSIQNGIMYVTTQPCHNCIKHIICSGIKKVIFCEPYPKSLGDELHSDAMLLDPEGDEIDNGKVLFLQYHGVSPSRFNDFFTLDDNRKDNKGYIIERTKADMIINPRYARNLWKRSRISESRDPITLKELDCLRNFEELIGKLTQSETMEAE